jgi:dihydroorotate dehydrogenase
MGFNNAGGEAALARLERRADRAGVVGINIGANKDSSDRIADYAKMTRLMTPHASYLAANISSPNTPGLRALQDEGALTALLDAVIEARNEVMSDRAPPIFLKVAPDLEPSDIDANREKTWCVDGFKHNNFSAFASLLACCRDRRSFGCAPAPACTQPAARFPQSQRR